MRGILATENSSSMHKDLFLQYFGTNLVRNLLQDVLALFSMCSKEICEGKGKDCLVVALVIQFAGKSLSHTDYLAAFAFIPCYFIIRMLATNTTPSVSRGGVTNIPSFSLDLEICSICWLFPQGNKPVTFEMVMLFTCFESRTSRLTCKLSIVCNFEIHCNLSL